MTNDIDEVLSKYKIDLAELIDLQSRMSYLENIILFSPDSNESKRHDISTLYKWKRKMLLSQLNSSTLMIERMRKISSELNFRISDDYITYDSFIPITAVINEDNCLVMLNNNIQNKLLENGYGITQFKIEKTHTIKDVWCQGKHPNINPSDSTFCIDSDFCDSSLDSYNLILLIEMLSMANIGSFYRSKESWDFLSIIKE